MVAGARDLRGVAGREQHSAGGVVGMRIERRPLTCRELYGEFTSTPAPEVLKRQRTGVERVVQMPDPDSLTPSLAFSASYGEG